MSDSPLGLLSALVGWYFSFAISDETEGVVKTEQGSVAYLRYGLWLNLWKWSHSPWKAMVVTMVWSLCILFGTIVCLLVVDMMFDVWSTAPILFWSFVVTMVVMFLPGPWRSHHVRQICRDPHMAVLLRAALEVLAPFADLEQPVDLSYGGYYATLVVELRKGGSVEAKLVHDKDDYHYTLRVAPSLLGLHDGEGTVLAEMTFQKSPEAQARMVDTMSDALHRHGLRPVSSGSGRGVVQLLAQSPVVQEVKPKSSRRAVLNRGGDLLPGRPWGHYLLFGCGVMAYLWIAVLGCFVVGYTTVAEAWATPSERVYLYWMVPVWGVMSLFGTPMRWLTRGVRGAPEPPRALLALARQTLTGRGVASGSIDLRRPFSTRLYRAPEGSDAGHLVVVELVQDALEGGSSRLRFGFCAQGDALEHLEVLAVQAPVCDAKPLVSWVWPTLAYYAALHGAPLRWSLSPRS